MGCSSSSPKLYTLSPSKAASEMSTARDCTGNGDAAMSAHQGAPLSAHKVGQAPQPFGHPASCKHSSLQAPSS